MIVYKSRWLTRGEVWFEEEPPPRKLDFAVYHQVPRPLPHSRWREFHTIVLDLRCSPQVLLSQMDRTTVYKIKRADDRDKTVCEFCDPSDPVILREFADMYDRFAQQRNWELMDRRWLTQTAKAGVLDLARAVSPNGETLVYHSLVRAKDRVRGIHSVSFFRHLHDSAARSYMGRANRFLHWKSMLRYKEMGITTYDFGGWYTGTTDQERLRINEFKKGFGGEVVCNYECEQILSLKGWLVLGAARALRRARSLPATVSEALVKTCENQRPTEIPAPVR